jgi:hypothetical protein
VVFSEKRERERSREFAGLDPVEAADVDIKELYKSALSALQRFRFRGFEREELLTVLGCRSATERLLASNKRLRRAAAHILIDEFSRLKRQYQRGERATFWHFSFIGPVVTEYQPRMDVDAFRNAVDGLMRATPLNAVVSMELQALTNYPQRGEGRGLLLNAHAVAWTDERHFHGAEAAAAMSGKSALHSELGADTVKCRRISLADTDIEYLGYYLLKAPADGKYRHKEGVKWMLKRVAAVRPSLRLRLLELLSLLEFTDLVHGIRGGSIVRSRWKRRLMAWNLTNCERAKQPLDADFDVAELWNRVRSREGNGSRKYKPVQLLGPRPRPIPAENWPRADGERLWPSERRSVDRAKSKPADVAQSLRDELLSSALKRM